MANAKITVSEDNQGAESLSNLHRNRAQLSSYLAVLKNSAGTHPAMIEKLYGIRSGIQHRINAARGQVH